MLQKLEAATKFSHAWDECEYYDPTNLTGIPAHVMIFVNHEKLSKQVDEKFGSHSEWLTKELDKRQMGGNMTMELIQESFVAPLADQIKMLGNKMDAMKKNSVNGGEAIDDSIPTFHWNSDGPNTPRHLPQDFQLATAITPLTIWQQWHHGLTFSGGIAVGPLKKIPAKDCPGASKTTGCYRSFLRMKKFCKLLDTTVGISGNESVAELGVLYQANIGKLRDAGILLPTQTPTGRKRKRNENSWNYIANKYEQRLVCQKRAAAQNLTLEEVENNVNERERERQRRKRIRSRDKDMGQNTEGMTNNSSVSLSGGGTARQAPLLGTDSRTSGIMGLIL